VKTLRKQWAVVILTFMLAVSTYAGQIQGPGMHSSGSGSGSSTGTGTGTTTLSDTTTTVILTIISVIP